ncbi:hypothetical protein VUJ49_23385 [Pseudomonas berkeleyensis]|uniref:G domain-containing protein n=1 Tax=Pseudomonas berkeleyensis TaxID=2726956 RepID=A0A7G5DMD3_9PSED|nr:hypothetical protein [Pseudomonas berkeleyensis]QMV62908.1 hypothetical protein HS968_23290 [Pseudomonas berkeleyensis]WSO38362.1 hypothetical protein VUJ49_23385 [Pseudomonas berkeleyensis]
MLPFIIAGVALTSLAAAATAYYKRSGDKEDKPTKASLGDIAIWGQQDAGKTTFIACLRGAPPTSDKKEQTSSIRRYSKFKVTSRDGQPHEIQELLDMPAGDDRLNNWLTEIETRKHIFYIITLAKFDDTEYFRKVRTDIAHTVERLKISNKESKRIHIIGAHLDNSKWKDFEPSRVREKILQDDGMREIREHLGKVAGYFYAANLLDPSSATRLIEDIIDDCAAQLP